MVIFENANLKSAISSLESEEKSLESRLTELQDKLATVRAALTPLRQLVGPSPGQSTGNSAIDEINRKILERPLAALGLPEAITHVLSQRIQPMSPADIARVVLEGGYTTQSGDFANVVGTTLRRLKGERFKQDENGLWSIQPRR